MPVLWWVYKYLLLNFLGLARTIEQLDIALKTHISFKSDIFWLKQSLLDNFLSPTEINALSAKA